MGGFNQKITKILNEFGLQYKFAPSILQRPVWQVVTAVSDGAVAAVVADEYLCDQERVCEKEQK